MLALGLLSFLAVMGFAYNTRLKPTTQQADALDQDEDSRTSLEEVGFHQPTSNTSNGDTLSVGEDTLRVLLPATQGDVDLCKTLLTMSILGYPAGHVVAWNETYDHPNQMAGGSHLAKIFKTLDYLETLPSTAANDLVLMIDAYDIWFQLPPSILIKRYHAFNAATDARNAQHYPSSTPAHTYRQRILFAAGKRCAPNQLHTLACYTLPDSPLPADLYAGNTDTVVGRNKYTSHRQRYLNSGYIMGTVSDLLPLFRAAAFEVNNTPTHDPNIDNGSGGSDYLYHGSDQSVFNILLGRQEYTREVARRSAGGKVQATKMEGSVIEDRLKPGFEHESFEYSTRHGLAEGVDSWEFGIGLDYWSEIGHQTVNSENDAKWMRLGEEPINTDFEGRNRFDCEARVDGKKVLGELEADHERGPYSGLKSGGEKGWGDVDLYANLCTGTVPVMVHHNGDKNARGYRWRDMWFQGRAREMLKVMQEGGRDLLASTDNEMRYEWEELCGGYDDMFE